MQLIQKTRQVGGKRRRYVWVEEGDMCGKRRDRRMGKINGRRGRGG